MRFSTYVYSTFAISTVIHAAPIQQLSRRSMGGEGLFSIAEEVGGDSALLSGEESAGYGSMGTFDRAGTVAQDLEKAIGTATTDADTGLLGSNSDLPIGSSTTDADNGILNTNGETTFEVAPTDADAEVSGENSDTTVDKANIENGGDVTPQNSPQAIIREMSTLSTEEKKIALKSARKVENAAAQLSEEAKAIFVIQDQTEAEEAFNKLSQPEQDIITSVDKQAQDWYNSLNQKQRDEYNIILLHHSGVTMADSDIAEILQSSTEASTKSTVEVSEEATAESNVIKVSESGSDTSTTGALELSTGGTASIPSSTSSWSSLSRKQKSRVIGGLAILGGAGTGAGVYFGLNSK